MNFLRTSSASYRAVAVLLLVAGLALPVYPDVPPPEMLFVPEGSFTMGRPDEEPGDNDELPRHEVILSPYEISKFEVTNAQYVEVLNWALKKNRIRKFSGDVRLHVRLLKLVRQDTEIVFRHDAYTTNLRNGFSVADYPVVDVTWFGAAAFTNWLSEMNGLDPCYDERTWKLITPIPNGYRLPTEAEWERAAGWDLWEAPKRFSFGYGADYADAQRLNYNLMSPMVAMGIVASPMTTPVGYYNGINPGTFDSPSPVGCYDMSGNVHEWTNDWYAPYTDAAKTDPTGPAEGVDILRRGPHRVLRGGGWGSVAGSCRISNRGFGVPGFAFRFFGFRIARSVDIETTTDAVE